MNVWINQFAPIKLTASTWLVRGSYDCVDQTVYWTEVTKGVIVRAKYDGSDMEVIVNSGEITSPEGERENKLMDSLLVQSIH